MLRRIIIFVLSLFLVIPNIISPVKAEEVNEKDELVLEETAEETIREGEGDSLQSIHYMGQTEYVNKYNAFLSDSRWKDGTAWGDSMTPYLGGGWGSGCFAYASDFAKYMYNENLWSENPDGKYYDISEIRAGDIIRDNESGEHWIVVLGRDGDTLYTAEGNVTWRRGVGYCNAQVLVTNVL